MALMELTFWYKGQKPGEVIDVSDPENPRWRGFAKLLPVPPRPVPEPRSVPEVAPRTASVKPGSAKD